MKKKKSTDKKKLVTAFDRANRFLELIATREIAVYSLYLLLKDLERKTEAKALLSALKKYQNGFRALDDFYFKYSKQIRGKK